VSRGDLALSEKLEENLLAFDLTERRLPGIRSATARQILIQQLIESVHRVRFVEVIRNRNLSELRGDPNSALLFDPLKAAVLHQQQGNVEEAFWLVFLFVHFGRNARGGWRYAREVYGKLGGPGRWDWLTTSANPREFREWLDARQIDLRRDREPGGFGNHRKYESLDAWSPTGTGAVVEGYIRWVAPPRTHQELVEDALRQTESDARRAFDVLYRSMSEVPRFGRTARFDYLSMLGKMNLATIEAGSTYMVGSTGPVKGARLLFGVGSETSTVTLDSWCISLGDRLQVGMQVIEDALCNWQKSPQEFRAFRG
jgi:hypothetical protein